MNKFSFRATAAAGLIALHLASAASAQQAQQPLAVPRPSPKATVSQTVGVTDITIHYNRPGVKNRKIWGELVPYGEVWRTGANENTTITFSTPVRIGGKELAAGTYGLQTIPAADQWTVIFSKDAELWGAFNYKQENDALRIQAKPETGAEHVERMTFGFEDVTDTSAKVVLRWEKLRVPFTVEVDTQKLFVESTRARAASLSSRDLYLAADYCLQANCPGDVGATWLDAAIAKEANFTNQRAKALMLAKKNDFKNAAAWGEKALAAAKTAQRPPSPQAVADLEKQIAEWKKK